jgi:hypothetical protein
MRFTAVLETRLKPGTKDIGDIGYLGFVAPTLRYTLYVCVCLHPHLQGRERECVCVCVFVFHGTASDIYPLGVSVCVMATRWVGFAHQQSPISPIPEFNRVSRKAVKRII